MFKKFNSNLFQFLDDGLKFNKKIEDFKKSYLKTQLSITLKVHIFVSHFVQFLQGTGFDLSLASEQSHESLHHDFLREWNRCGMKDDARPNFGSTLLSCIVRYNSNHIP
mgnify:CR=1 FL=1